MVTITMLLGLSDKVSEEGDVEPGGAAPPASQPSICSGAKHKSVLE